MNNYYQEQTDIKDIINSLRNLLYIGKPTDSISWLTCTPIHSVTSSHFRDGVIERNIDGNIPSTHGLASLISTCSKGSRNLKIGFCNIKSNDKSISKEAGPHINTKHRGGTKTVQ